MVNPSNPRHGYALLLVMITLVIVATLLVRLSNQALRQSAASLEAERMLRVKWGSISCERAALNRAETYFADWEQSRSKESVPVELPGRQSNGPLVRQQVQLGDCRFDLLIADEDAKANLYSSTEASNTLPLDSALRSLVPPKFTTQLRLTTRVHRRHWGELFDLRQMRKQYGTLRVLPEATVNVSLFGSGILNVHRASDSAFREMASTVVPQGRADRLIETLRDSPNMNVETLLRKTIKNESEQSQLQAILGDRSSTYSVWTEGFSGRGQHQLTYHVRRVDENGLVESRRYLIE